MKRRNFLLSSGAGSLGFVASKSCTNQKLHSENTLEKDFKLKGRIKHSVSQWCFGKYPLDTFLPILKEIGIPAIDLIGEKDWPTLKKHGIDCSMCNGAEINLVDGWNDPKFHRQLIQSYTETIPKVAAAGYKNLICFSGNRRGVADDVGLQHCVDGLSKIMPLAEKHNVVITMELFNSKVDHADYMCDSTAWGVQLCKALESDHFKLLYDIYHMQVQEGNIIQTIKDFHPYFSHYHTAGVPGRNEINNSQELNYPAVMQAILDTGFTGYVAQEFIPTYEDPIDSLKEAISICDI